MKMLSLQDAEKMVHAFVSSLALIIVMLYCQVAPTLS
uniref:Uncharacterized protein n=1 Tax=Anguilla anguilla TaxID=7936 RepID=A0A0E9VK58_ANGAN